MKSKHSLIFLVSNFTKWSLPPRIGKLLLLPLESPSRSFTLFFLLSSADWSSCLEKYTNFIRDPAHMRNKIEFQILGIFSFPENTNQVIMKLAAKSELHNCLIKIGRLIFKSLILGVQSYLQIWAVWSKFDSYGVLTVVNLEKINCKKFKSLNMTQNCENLKTETGQTAISTVIGLITFFSTRDW